jgi:hypothetical protein
MYAVISFDAIARKRTVPFDCPAVIAHLDQVTHWAHAGVTTVGTAPRCKRPPLPRCDGGMAARLKIFWLFRKAVVSVFT